MRLSTAPRLGWNMAAIFFRREVLLPDCALELVSGDFTVAAFRFIVVVAFDLADRSEFGVEVLLQRDQCYLCREEYHREHKRFHIRMARNREGLVVYWETKVHSSQPSSGLGCSCAWCGDKSRANVAGLCRDMLGSLVRNEEVSCQHSHGGVLLGRS